MEPNCNIFLKEMNINYSYINVLFDVIHKSPVWYHRIKDLDASYHYNDDRQLLNVGALVDISQTDELEVKFSDNVIRKLDRIDKFISALLLKKFDVVADYVVVLKLRQKG